MNVNSQAVNPREAAREALSRSSLQQIFGTLIEVFQFDVSKSTSASLRFGIHAKGHFQRGSFALEPPQPFSPIYPGYFDDSVSLWIDRQEQRRRWTLTTRPICFLIVLLCLGNKATSQSLGTYGKDFITSTWNLGTLWEPALSAGWSNYVTKPTGFATGAEGYGYHYGVALADNVNGKFMREFAFAAASGRPHNYVPLGSGNLWKRIWNAVEYTLIVPSQVSSRSFNWSGVPASFASAGLSNVYQPVQQRTWLATFERTGTDTAGYIVGNVWLEFTKKRACDSA